MAKNVDKSKESKISQTLVHIQHTITHRQIKYWYYMLSQYAYSHQRNELATKIDDGFYFVPMAQVTEMLGYLPTKKELKADLEALRQEPIIINYLEKDGETATRGMGFISEWKVSTKRMGFKFPGFIEQVLRNETEGRNLFLLINWSIFNCFAGKYEAIIYKLCKDYLGVGRTPSMTVEAYRKYAGLVGEEYKQFKELNRWAISTPIKNINKSKLSDISVDVVLEKSGRRVVSLYFKMKLKKNKQININPHPSFSEAIVFISAEDQVKLLEKYSDDDIKAIIERVNTYIESKKAQGNKPNYQALYNKAFEEGWGINQQQTKELSEAQLARIARSEKFKADYNHLISPTSPINNDYTGQAWVTHFVKELKKDTSKFNKRPIEDYLI